MADPLRFRRTPRPSTHPTSEFATEKIAATFAGGCSPRGPADLGAGACGPRGERTLLEDIRHYADEVCSTVSCSTTTGRPKTSAFPTSSANAWKVSTMKRGFGHDGGQVSNLSVSVLDRPRAMNC